MKKDDQVVIYVGPKIGLRLLKLVLRIKSNYKYLIISKEDICPSIDELKKINENIDYYQITYSYQEDNRVNGKYFINLWGEEILKEDFISKFDNAFNIHPSFLPWGKGRDPIVWTIINNWPAGATFHVINSEVDGGPIVYQERLYWTFPITGAELYEKTIVKCEEVLVKGWGKIVRGELVANEQANSNLPTMRRNQLYELQKNKFADLKKMSGEDLLRLVLALDFNEDFQANLQIENQNFSLKILFRQIEN